MEKKAYEILKDIKTRIENDQYVSFAERNIYNIAQKKKARKKKQVH